MFSGSFPFYASHYDSVVIPLLPFAGLDRRTAWLRGTLLLATLLGLLASAPVWLNSRSFPLLPITGGFPILPAPWDKILFISILLALVLAAWFNRAGVICFLVLSFLGYCGDQNRGQPWLYMYWVMLLLTLLPERHIHAAAGRDQTPPHKCGVPGTTALAACRWALALVYLWGGIQKCNELFFAKTPAWFVSPAANWHLPTFAIEALRLAAASAPVLEIAIAIALWSATTRRAALAAVAVMHLFALLFLGPLGHNYNWVVWPWNVAMIALAFTLFPILPKSANAKPLFGETITTLIRSRAAMAVLIPFTLLPVLSYTGRWDSAFSFALYSESNATANIFMSQRAVDSLPPRLRPYATAFPQFDPQRQGPFIFNFAAWAIEEMDVPPISEPRNFRNVFNALRPYAKEVEDVRMIVGERGRRVTFHQGDAMWELQGK